MFNSQTLKCNYSIPLVVDLDGTLLKTDLLFESASDFATRNPLKIFKLLVWISLGKSKLKENLAKSCVINPELLPYNEELIEFLREQKVNGRSLILATASHKKLAISIAQYLNLFDQVLASEDSINLKGKNKCDCLIREFGEKKFDYIGDCSADLYIWQFANQGYIVSSSQALIRRVQKQATIIKVFDDNKQPLIKSLLKAMRPHQWTKNLLIFVPMMSAHMYGDVRNIALTLIAFLIFNMTASSVYLFNDLVDLNNDRHHTRKKKRPFASGDLSLLHGWIAVPLLLVTAFALAIMTMPPKFLGALGIYYLLTLTYSLFLKQKPILDVLVLAGLYTLRIIAGATAIPVSLSFWLLSFSIFIFLSLASMKRFSEIQLIRNIPERSQIPGRGYVREDLEVVSAMGTSAGYMSVLVLALYIQDSHTAEMYQSPTLIWGVCPLILYWISRAWLIAHRGNMHYDPIVFALKDKVSWVIIGMSLSIFALARLIG